MPSWSESCYGSWWYINKARNEHKEKLIAKGVADGSSKMGKLMQRFNRKMGY